MLSKATNQPKSNIELGYMCAREPTIRIFLLAKVCIQNWALVLSSVCVCSSSRGILWIKKSIVGWKVGLHLYLNLLKKCVYCYNVIQSDFKNMYLST